MQHLQFDDNNTQRHVNNLYYFVTNYTVNITDLSPINNFVSVKTDKKCEDSEFLNNLLNIMLCGCEC
jgi:hypothetical protein